MVSMAMRYILRFADQPLAIKDLQISSSIYYRVKRHVDRLWALHPRCSTIFPKIIIHTTSPHNYGNLSSSLNFPAQSKMVLRGNAMQMECLTGVTHPRVSFQASRNCLLYSWQHLLAHGRQTKPLPAVRPISPLLADRSLLLD